MAQVRTKLVLCNRTDCLHCAKMDNAIPIEATREPGFVPLLPIVFETACDKSQTIVLDKNGDCTSFASRHPDKMYAATKRAKGSPSYEVLGLVTPKYPTVKERCEKLFTTRKHWQLDSTGVHELMKEAYLAGREDEKYNVRVDT